MESFGPDFADLVDAEAPPVAMQSIPVDVQGSVMTEERATTFAGMATVAAVPFAGAVRVLTADPRRRLAVVLGLTQAIRIGRTQSQANLAGAVWPATTPLTIHARDEVWISCATSGMATDVSIIVERWT